MLSIWFMYDNHTFGRIKSRERDGMIAEATEKFKEDGCGTLFVRDKWDGELKNLCLHGRQLGNGQWGVLKEDIEKWADAVLIEHAFQKSMIA